MPKVVGIKFKGTAKVYWFDAGNLEYTEGAPVIVETARGVEMGYVKTLPEEMPESKIVSPLKPIMRIASQEDLKRQEENAAKIGEVLKTAEAKVVQRGIKMKLVSAQYTADGGKLIFYFTASGRVDFRDLVKDLASAFHIRIELRQIGDRDECRMIGCLGMCGRQCCCASCMDFTKVNIKMAKNQNLSLNPQKISGACGRLMCCLAYENDHYVETNRKMPKVGASVSIAGGASGTVVSINQLKLTVRVRTETKDGFEISDHPLDDVVKHDKSSAADDTEISGDELGEDLKKIQD